MQQITLDLNSIGYEPIYAGEIGESRAVRLYLIPPSYMADDTNITKYNVAFKVAAGVVLSEFFTQSDDIIIDLGAPLTEESTLLFQLIGMSADGETVISKTPTIRLIIGDSIEGELIPDPATGKTIYAEISDLDARVTALEEGGAGDYEALSNLPQINNHTLIGNKTSAELGIAEAGDALELYDSATGKPKYSVTEIDQMYADGKLMTWKGRFVLAVDANTQWNRYLYFPRENAGRQVLIYKQSVQNGSVVGDEEQIGGFSDLNFTQTHYNRLYGIEAGAQKNVQTDYTEADSSKDSFLKNKPTKLSDFTNDVGFITETTYTEIYDTANSQSFYTGTEIKTMFENNIPLVYTLANGIKYFVYAVEGSSTITLQLWTVVNSVGGSTGWAGKATIPASTKAISDVTIYTKTVLSSDISKFTGGSVSQGNTKFVTGGQVYDAVSAKQDTLTAGTNITISNNVISATGGASSADDVSYDNTDSGLTATNVQDAIDEVVTGKQNTLTAGQNITIQNDVISASGGSSLPVATADKDVIYWDNANQTYVAGAITNVIPDGDNLSY